MKGFLLNITEFSFHPHFELPFLSNQSQLKVTKQLIAPTIHLFTWGDGPGDIYVSIKPDNSLLILVGYISETTILPQCSNQQDICSKLRLHLDMGLPSSAISTLAASFHGSFSLIYVSLKDKKISTVTDRVASRPLWYQKDKDSLRISSHAVAIAKHSGTTELAPGNLASYLLYATQIDPTRTLFPNIRSQKEGSLLQFMPDQTCTETKWYKFQHAPDEKRSLSSWLDLTTNCFLTAANRLLKTTTRPLLFLSGGVDSRIAGAALVAAGGHPLLCTLGDSQNLEIKAAIAVAHALQRQHVIMLRDDEWYLRGISQAMFNAHGMFSWVHSHFSEAYAALQASHNVDAAILGDFCEAFSKLCFTVPVQRKHLWTIKEFLADFDQLPLPNYRPFNRKVTLKLLREEVREVATVSLDHDISERYSEASTVSTDPLIVGDYFFRGQNTSCIATFQMFNDVRYSGPERNLMFDKELHQLLEIMPSAIRDQTNLGSKIVNKLCPKAAWVPNANTLLPLPFPLAFHSLAKTVRPKFGKLRRLFFTNDYKTTASWPHLPLLYAGHTKWKERIEEYLFDGALVPKEIFDQKEIAICWQDFCKGDLSRHSDIERLLGLAELRKLLK